MDHSITTENGDNFLRVRRLCELAEFIHDEWTRVIAANTHHQPVNSTSTNVACEISKLLIVVQCNVQQCIDIMLSVMKSVSRDVIDSVYAKVKRKYAIQITELIRLPDSRPSSTVSSEHIYHTVDHYYRELDKAKGADNELSCKQEVFIRTNFAQLVERLDAQSIASIMFERQAITLAELHAIQVNRLQPCKAAESLLDILM